MATFDQLSAEQRAIIELVLKQGQTYEQLGEMLGLSSSRVRELAREALVRLSPVSAAAVEDDWRGQLGDYLLNQQSGPESTATRGHLRRSEAARGWARSVLDSLEQFYDEKSLPTIPAGDGGAEAGAPRKRREHREKGDSERAKPARELSPAAREVVRRRRLLGAGAAAALVLLVALLFWPIGLLDGDDDTESQADSSSPATAEAGEQAQLLGQLPLAPVEGLADSQSAQGIAVIAERAGQRQVIVQARLPNNRRNEAYQVWLYNSDKDALSLGAQVADRQGNFQGAGPLPENFDDYKFIDVSREPLRGPEGHAGKSVLRGALADLTAVPDQAQGASPGGGQGDVPSP
ncbi:MAG: anti-sigma factor [Actinomycetota bacterium]|nr:anti-sigma factor [Actinomycetota bacterium]